MSVSKDFNYYWIIVPKRIVNMAIIIRILLMIKAEVLFINKRKLFFLFGDLIKNIKKPTSS